MADLRHPSLLPGQIDAPHAIAALGDLALESGEAILDYRQSYVTHGELNSDRSNTILVCASLTGTHHRLDFLIGPGKALDPFRYFIVATDAIGNGLSTSPSNSRAQPGMRFPRFGLRDMVSAQHRLLTEHLGIQRVHAVVGASMGGMQALQWAVSHPRFALKAVAMTPMARTTPWSRMVTQTARACLMADPAWTGAGFERVPARGWRAYASLMSTLVMRTPEAVSQLVGEGEAQAWSDQSVAQHLAADFDAHDYLYQSWAYDAHDVGTTPGFGGDTRAALASIRTRMLLLSPPLDLFNPSDAARGAARAIAGAQFAEIPSVHGHQAATSLDAADVAFMNRVVGDFLRD